MLSKTADFEYYDAEIDGKHVELIRIHKALNEPVSFQKVDYIRSGSYTKKLHEFPVFRAQLWDKLRSCRFSVLLTVAGVMILSVMSSQPRSAAR